MVGLSTFLVLMIILAVITIHGFSRGELYFDTKTWQIRKKNENSSDLVESKKYRNLLMEGE